MRTRALLGALAAICLLAAVGCFAQAWRSTGHRQLIPFRAAVAAHPAPPRLHPLIRSRPHSGKAHRVGPLRRRVPLRAPRPVRVVVPAIGLSARVVPGGLDSAGQMEVPDPSVAGWYRRGPAPGALGPAVIVGHVDTYKGPAVFYRLTAIRRGDEVRIVRADGSRSRFVISRVTVVRKATFPSEAVFGPTRNAGLRLITCTGTFDTNTLSYLDSLIAWGHFAH